MKAKKPDRFERMVEASGAFCNKDAECLECKPPKRTVVNLLRKEHRAVVKMVKAQLKAVSKVKRIVGKDDAHACGMQDMGEVILDLLKKRAT